MCVSAHVFLLLIFPQLLVNTMSFISLEECELLSDSKYRAYISQVEKALKSFEYTSEWADLISALGKLNKVSFVKYLKLLSINFLTILNVKTFVCMRLMF